MHIELPGTLPDKHIAAELWAIQRLIETDEVCGKDRTGNSMAIVCSLGAIRKLAAGKSDKVHLVPYALFLRTRFAEATIECNKDPGFLDKNRYSLRETSHLVEGPAGSMIKVGDSSVAVTAHALERFQRRHNVSSVSDAWRALRAAAGHPGTQPCAMDADEGRKYARSSVCYRSPTGYRFIVVPEQTGPVLVTAYYRPNG
jgi:hypothetical protein